MRTDLVIDALDMAIYRIAVLVIPTNNSRTVQRLVPALLQSLKVVEAGMYVTMDVGHDSERWQDLRFDRDHRER